jgi:hypothetical protein
MRKIREIWSKMKRLMNTRKMGREKEEKSNQNLSVL